MAEPRATVIPRCKVLREQRAARIRVVVAPALSREEFAKALEANNAQMLARLARLKRLLDSGALL